MCLTSLGAVLKGSEPLDETNLHPDDYKLAKKIVKKKISDAELIEKFKTTEGELLRGRESLERGNCDVRLLGIGGGGNKTKPDNWTELKTSDYDLPKLNASLPLHGILGKVKNVVAFGAFVDIGLKTDGLLHIKHFNNRDTSIFAGARIGVDVLGVDVGRGRVELGLAEAGRISGGLGKRKRSE